MKLNEFSPTLYCERSAKDLAIRLNCTDEDGWTYAPFQTKPGGMYQILVFDEDLNQIGKL